MAHTRSSQEDLGTHFVQGTDGKTRWEDELKAFSSGHLPDTGAGTPWPPRYTWRQRRLLRRL